MRSAWIFLVLLWAPGFAWAQAWTHPNGNTMTSAVVDRPGKVALYELSGTTDSAILTTTVDTTWMFDPDTGTEGTATAQGHVRRCSASATTCAAAACPKVLVNSDGTGGVDDTDMDGDDGGTTAQRTFIYDVPPGRYCFDVTTGPGGGETGDSIVEVTGGVR